MAMARSATDRASRLTRRDLLRVSGSAAGAFGLLLAAASLPPGIALAAGFANAQSNPDALSQGQLRQQLVDLSQSPASQAAVQAMSAGLLAAGPAIIAESQLVLQTASASLTGFQKSLLQAVPIAFAHPEILSALMAGQSLTAQQRQQLQQDRRALQSNAAVQRIIAFAQPLQKNDQQAALAADVNQLLPGLQGLAAGQVIAPILTGDPNLDVLFHDLLTPAANPSVQATAGSLLPLLQDPAFVPLLQHQPGVGALLPFIPRSQILSLLLPGDQDPTPAQIVQLKMDIALFFLYFGLIILGLAGGFIAVFALLIAFIVSLVVLYNEFHDVFSSPTPDLLGCWSVTYGAPAVVEITFVPPPPIPLKLGLYTITAVTTVQVTGGVCILPKGTQLATFSGLQSPYSGQHNLFFKFICNGTVEGSTPLTLTLDVTGAVPVLTGVLAGDGTLTFTKLPHCP